MKGNVGMLMGLGFLIGLAYALLAITLWGGLF
jgi:hypothetical protein